MRRVIATVVGTVTALVLLLSFKTHPGSAVAGGTVISTPAVPSAATPSLTPSASAAASAAATAGASGTSSTATAAPKTTTAPTKATTTAKRTIDGEAVDTRYGPVQVQVALTGTTITAINILQVPNSERRDVEINDYAVPLLDQEALQAQSAKIDMVSGATYTSVGYLQSLQSALDKAKTG